MAARRLHLVALLILLAASPNPAAAQTPAVGASSTPFWSGITDAAAFERAMDARLAHAREMVDALLAVKTARTIANTLRPFDDAALELDAVGSQAGLIQSVHPDEPFRQAAERVFQKVSTAATQLSLNRGVYDAIRTLDIRGADEETTYY